MKRLFFCTDLHGSDICFRKFLHAGSAYKADVVIMGGDCTGKMIVPSSLTETGPHVRMAGAHGPHVSTPEQLAEAGAADHQQRPVPGAHAREELRR